jgi:glycosyltransferase involved in cell wall biosynthesis
MENIKLAYIHTMAFPSQEANALDAIWTASALSRRVNTTFFMPRRNTSISDMKKYYGISDSPLRIQSMYLNLFPDRFLLAYKNSYEQALSIHFHIRAGWAGFIGQKILYVRHPKELLFWGLQRERQKWLRNWTLCYESHDPLGLNPNHFQGKNPFELKDGTEGIHRQAVLKAAKNFDLIICNSQALAEDLESWTKKNIQPHFVPLASLLPRLPESPKIHFGERILLGYIGTIDQYRGVNILLEAMRYLPKNCFLKIVGRFREEEGVDPDWLNKVMGDLQIGPKVELKGPIPINEVMDEIDQCDIVIQPASADILDSRYATPQKSFDYMVRGKPIVAGDVPCHRELFHDGKSATLYRLNPQSLAECVMNLVRNPGHAEKIAREAWEQSAQYYLARRVDNILNLVESCRKDSNHSPRIS